MGHEGDDLVSLPAPPPPNPAARRSAIDTALRRFDGIEEAPSSGTTRARPPLLNWASSHRRAAGGLVTAALVAVLAFPVVQVALRDQSAEVASEKPAPRTAQPAIDAAPASPALPEQTASDRILSPELLPNEPHDTAPAAVEQRSEIAAKPTQTEETAPPASVGYAPAEPALVAATPPPPPPPTPPPPSPSAPAPQRQAAEASDASGIVVTGSRTKRANMESAAPVTVVTAEDAYADFHEKLQSAFRTNDRRAVLSLIGFPLRVDFDGDSRTYRNRSEVERDFGRIFTAEVRESVRSGQAGRRLTFAPLCSRQPCPSGNIIRIRAVRP